MIRKMAQWAAIGLLGTVGFLAFLILCGEETPGQPMSDGVFFGSKLAAGAVLYLCILAGRYFDRRGWLPEVKEPDEEDGWKDEEIWEE